MSVLKDVHDIVKEEAKTPGGQWVLLHTLGGAIGAVISAMMGLALGGLANWAVFGLTLGIIQMFMLKDVRKYTIFWLIFSGLAWAIMAGSPIGNFMALVVTGSVLGILQGLLIAFKRRRAYLWLGANVIAWPIGGAIGFVVAGEVTKRGAFGFDFVAGLAGSCFVASIFLWAAIRNMPKRLPVSSTKYDDSSSSEENFKQSSESHQHQTPLDIAKMRYAKGEITRKELEELKEGLS